MKPVITILVDEDTQQFHFDCAISDHLFVANLLAHVANIIMDGLKEESTNGNTDNETSNS